MLIFSATYGQSLCVKFSLAKCQINKIDLYFHLEKSFEFLIKTLVTKSDPKRERR